MNKYKASEFSESLEELTSWYPLQVNFALQNLLDSHDTDRIVSGIKNRAGWKRGRIQDDNPKYDGGKPSVSDYNILRLIVSFQMCFIGSPMIYYGDEAGMWGADDPSDRKPMLWKDLEPYDDPKENVRAGLLNFYKKMIAIRNTYEPLKRGTFQSLFTDDKHSLFAFKRELKDNRVYIIINNSDKKLETELKSDEKDGTLFIDIAGVKNYRIKEGLIEANSPKSKYKFEKGRIRVKLSPKSAAILVRSET